MFLTYGPLYDRWHPYNWPFMLRSLRAGVLGEHGDLPPLFACSCHRQVWEFAASPPERITLAHPTKLKREERRTIAAWTGGGIKRG